MTHNTVFLALLPLWISMLSPTASTSPTRFHSLELSHLLDQGSVGPGQSTPPHQQISELPFLPVYYNNFYKTDQSYWTPSEGFTRKTKETDGVYYRPSRGRVERMPLTYGKRSGLASHAGRGQKDLAFSRTLRSRLHRMPVNFGKRSENEGLSSDVFLKPKRFLSPDLDSEQDGDAPSSAYQTKPDFSVAPNYVAAGERDATVDKERLEKLMNYLTTKPKQLVQTYLTSNAKANPIPLNGAHRFSDNLLHVMSADVADAFGYGLRYAGVEDCDMSDPRCSLTSSFDRNSEMASPLGQEYEPVSPFNRLSSWYSENGMSAKKRKRRSVEDEKDGQRKSGTNFIEAFIGKRHKDRKRSTLNKHSKLYDKLFLNSKRSFVDRMPLTFGKRANEIASYLNFKRGSGMDRKRQSTSKRRPTEANHSEYRRRSSMSRMPLTFGKRKLTDRMPLTFGRRSLAGRTTLTPGKRFYTGQMPLSFDSTKLTRPLGKWPKRSSMYRMPLYYGKRSPTGRVSTRRSPRKEFPFNFGKHSANKRPAMDRMPLTFGKRETLHQSLLTLGKRSATLKSPVTLGRRTSINVQHSVSLGSPAFEKSSKESSVLLRLADASKIGTQDQSQSSLTSEASSVRKGPSTDVSLPIAFTNSKEDIRVQNDIHRFVDGLKKEALQQKDIMSKENDPPRNHLRYDPKTLPNVSTSKNFVEVYHKDKLDVFEKQPNLVPTPHFTNDDEPSAVPRGMVTSKSLKNKEILSSVFNMN